MFNNILIGSSETSDSIKLKKVIKDWFLKSFSIKEFEGTDLALRLFLGYTDKWTLMPDTKAWDLYKSRQLLDDCMKNAIVIPELQATGEIGSPDSQAYAEAAVYIINDTFQYIQEQIKNEELSLAEFKVRSVEYLNQKVQHKLKRVAHDILDATEFSDGTNYLEKLEKKVFELKTVYSNEVLREFDSALERETEGQEQRLVSQFNLQKLDNMLLGGLMTRTLTLIESKTGAGKTTFTVGTLEKEAILNGKNVLHIALEQNAVEIKAKLITSLINSVKTTTYVSATNIQTLAATNKEELARLRAKDPSIDAMMCKYESWDEILRKGGEGYGKYTIISTTDDKRDAIYLEELQAYLERSFLVNGKPDLLVIDYIGLIPNKARPNDDWPPTGSTAAILKRIAMFYDIAVVAVGQLNKEGSQKAGQGKVTGEGESQGGTGPEKTLDLQLVLLASEEMQMTNKMLIQVKKARAFKKIPPFPINTNIGGVLFWED